MRPLEPEPGPPVREGDVLADKYEVRRVIGRGGMGIVVEARHTELGQRVALKFLLREFAFQQEAAGRFLREARASARIKSEHVARVSDVGRFAHGEPYMVMEFLEGQDLSRELTERGHLSVEDAVDFIIQASEAVGEAHSYGIVHRDLKPSNLFLTRRPDGTPLVKVLDFGISKVAEADNLTKTSVAMGSALYMSPEQMESARDVDARTDVYSLGISLFELIAGRTPFAAESLPQLCNMVMNGRFVPLRSLRPEVPADLEQLVHRTFAKDRSERPQSVAALVGALTPFAPSRSGEDIGRVMRLAATSGSELAPSEGLSSSDPAMTVSSATGMHADTLRMGDKAAEPALPSEASSRAPNETPPSVDRGATDGTSSQALSVDDPAPPKRSRALVALGAGALGLVAIAAFALRGPAPETAAAAATNQPTSGAEQAPTTAPEVSAPVVTPAATPSAESPTSASAAAATASAAGVGKAGPPLPPSTAPPVSNAKPPPPAGTASPPPPAAPKPDVWGRY